MRNVLKTVTHFISAVFAIGSLAVVTIALAAVLLVGDVAEGEGFRRQLERSLARAAGPGRTVEIGQARLRFGSKGWAAVVLDEVRIEQAGGEQPLTIGSAAVQLRMLPLLAGRMEAQTLTLRDTAIDVAPFLRARSAPPLGAIAEADLQAALQALGQSLFAAERGLRASGLETVTLADVRLAGIEKLGLRSRKATVRDLRIVRDDRFTEGVRVKGAIALESSRIDLAASWEQRNNVGGSRALHMRVSNIDLSEFPRVRPASQTPLGAEATVDVTAWMPFAPDATPDPAFVTFEVGAGRGWFADREPTPLHRASLRLRVTPSLNSVAVLPSSFETASVAGTLTGGIAREKGSRGLAFELVGNDLKSTAGGVSAVEHAAIRIAGNFDPLSGILRFDDIQARSPDGSVEGSGRMDLTSWTPAMRFRLRAERLRVATARAFWPTFIAYGQRRFVAGGAFEGGEIVDGSLSLDVPATVMGRLRKGATLEPGQLSMHLPFQGVSVRTVGDLPRIDQAAGTVRVEGTSVFASLDAGSARVDDADPIRLKGGTLTISDFLQQGLPAEIAFNASGQAAALLDVGARHPLKVTQAIGLKAGEATGSADLAVRISSRLKLPPGEKPDGWAVEADIRKGSVARFRGRRIEDADLAVVARPGLVRIDGRARVDGVAAQLALVEPFGSTATEEGGRTATLRLDAKARRALGLNVENYLSGTVVASVRDLRGGRQAVSVDLTPIALTAPFVPWKKGKGVPGRLTFTMIEQGDRTRLADLRLSGKGFSARGSVSFDRRGLRSVDLPVIRINAADTLSLKAKRRKNGYDLDVLGSEFDLRSIMRKLVAKGPAAPGGVDLRVNARFDRLRGYGQRSLTGATLRLDLRKGEIRTLDFRAVSGGNAPLRFSMKPQEGAAGTAVQLDSHDAGGLLAFTNVYSKMRGGRLRMTLNRDREGIFAGRIQADRFTVFGEPRLRQLVAKRRLQNAETPDGRRVASTLNADRADVKRVRARIRRGPGFLSIQDGQLRGGDMAAIFEGTVYDRRGRIAMKGTFLPAYGLNRALSNIPVLGYAMGNGRKRGLLGITFRLRGMYRDPRLEVNPISLLTPGVFRRIFE